mmetsp:Transcript_3247/g.7947  ORF Transcript_3247/g.7947 Transcript_3247/m.7947 type:complete len:291 (+) Transcript_3247:889-1761(+)
MTLPTRRSTRGSGLSSRTPAHWPCRSRTSGTPALSPRRGSRQRPGQPHPRGAPKGTCGARTSFRAMLRRRDGLPPPRPVRTALLSTMACASRCLRSRWLCSSRAAAEPIRRLLSMSTDLSRLRATGHGDVSRHALATVRRWSSDRAAPMPKPCSTSWAVLSAPRRRCRPTACRARRVPPIEATAWAPAIATRRRGRAGSTCSCRSGPSRKRTVLSPSSPSTATRQVQIKPSSSILPTSMSRVRPLRTTCGTSGQLRELLTPLSRRTTSRCTTRASLSSPPSRLCEISLRS